MLALRFVTACLHPRIPHAIPIQPRQKRGNGHGTYICVVHVDLTSSCTYTNRMCGVTAGRRLHQQASSGWLVGTLAINAVHTLTCSMRKKPSKHPTRFKFSASRCSIATLSMFAMVVWDPVSGVRSWEYVEVSRAMRSP